MRVIEKIGYVAIVYWGYKFSRGVVGELLKSYFSPSQTPIELASLGKWGAITGCSQGIGKAYAEALARMGLNVVLISPADAKSLEIIAKRIENLYKVKTKVVRLDFSEGMEMYERIEREVLGMDIGVLVNSLGMCYPHPEYFLQLPHKEKIYMNIIHCNVIVVTNMCRIFLPRMVLKRKGLIVNVASTFAVIPSPLLTVFAATKAYVLKFSRDLQTEYGRSGIIVQCLLPGTITSPTTDCPSLRWLIPTPDEYVEKAIQTIGNEEVTTGFLPHTFLIGIVKFFYGISSTLVIFFMTKVMEGNRTNALRRYIG